jgi:hypothetical protein
MAVFSCQRGICFSFGNGRLWVGRFVSCQPPVASTMALYICYAVANLGPLISLLCSLQAVYIWYSGLFKQ